MDSSNEKVLLESCCFLLDYHQEQIKRKRIWVREIFKKRIEQGVYHNILQEMTVNDRESYFRLFHNELFSEMAWSLVVPKKTIKNCTTALQTFSFRSLSLYPLFPFSKRQGYFCISSAKHSASCI